MKRVLYMVFAFAFLSLSLSGCSLMNTTIKEDVKGYYFYNRVCLTTGGQITPILKTNREDKILRVLAQPVTTTWEQGSLEIEWAYFDGQYFKLFGHVQFDSYEWMEDGFSAGTLPEIHEENVDLSGLKESSCDIKAPQQVINEDGSIGGSAELYANFQYTGDLSQPVNITFADSEFQLSLQEVTAASSLADAGITKQNGDVSLMAYTYDANGKLGIYLQPLFYGSTANSDDSKRTGVFSPVIEQEQIFISSGDNVLYADMKDIQANYMVFDVSYDDRENYTLQTNDLSMQFYVLRDNYIFPEISLPDEGTMDVAEQFTMPDGNILYVDSVSLTADYGSGSRELSLAFHTKEDGEYSIEWEVIDNETGHSLLATDAFDDTCSTWIVNDEQKVSIQIMTIEKTITESFDIPLS